MWNFGALTKSRLPLALAVLTSAAIGFGLARPLMSVAQDKTDPLAAPAQPPNKPNPHTDKDLAAQVAELNDKVAKLMAAVDKTHPGQPPAMSPMPGGKGMAAKPGMGMGMDEMGGKGMAPKAGPGMGMGEMGDKGMAGNPGPGMGMPMMGMDAMGMMGMMGMGSMAGPNGMGKGSMPDASGIAKMQAAAALPGFPGASHLYHIGATGFFLDHPQHVTLTTKQQADLNHLKEKTLLDKETAQRMIDGAEQGLWLLTASDAPEIASIQEKVAEVEKLRGEQRIAFIRGVGEAAKVLTVEQRQALLGTAAHATAAALAPAAADPHAGHKP